jgi:acyl carrier protein
MAITPDQVLDIIAKEVPMDRAKLDPAATLEQLDIASLDMISVTFALEDQFGVVVEQADFAHARTLQDFVDVIIAKADGSPAAEPGA